MKIYFVYGFDGEANPAPYYATLNKKLAEEEIEDGTLEWIEEFEINDVELTDLCPP